MIEYQIGKAFPAINASPGQSSWRSQTNNLFFDVLYFLKKPDRAKVDMWNRAELHYAIYIEAHIPFFVVNFPETGWSFNVSTNILTIKNEGQDAWLNGNDNEIWLFLIDSDTNILQAIRTLEIDKEAAKSYRDTLKRQKLVYSSEERIDNKISSIEIPRNVSFYSSTRNTFVT